MATYATALPCPNTSMTADIRATVTATARVDNSGWDIAYSQFLIATNSSGFPFNNSPSASALVIAGTTRLSQSATYNFPSGHGTGYVISRGSGSYFLPVTPTGDGSLSISYSFTDGGSPVLGSGSGSGTLTLPHIDVSPLREWNGTAWIPQKMRKWNGTAWILQKISKWSGTAWVQQH